MLAEMLEISNSIDFCQVMIIIHPPHDHQFKLKHTWFWMMETVWHHIFPNRQDLIFFMEEGRVFGILNGID